MTHVISRVCAHRRAPGMDDLARMEARETLAVLTERERAMFALALLTEVNNPVLSGLIGFISHQVKQHAERLFDAAVQKHAGEARGK